MVGKRHQHMIFPNYNDKKNAKKQTAGGTPPIVVETVSSSSQSQTSSIGIGEFASLLDLPRLPTTRQDKSQY